MAGLAADAANFFKFLFVVVLYTLVMTLWVNILHPHLAIVTDRHFPPAELLVGYRI